MDIDAFARLGRRGAPVWVMELDRVYGFDMDLRAALVTNGEVIELDTLCKEASARVGGVC